jgi:hypothetical protein
MPYWIALVPAAAAVGVVGAVVSVVRGRRRSALIFALVGLAAILYAIVGYYTSR